MRRGAWGLVGMWAWACTSDPLPTFITATPVGSTAASNGGGVSTDAGPTRPDGGTCVPADVWRREDRTITAVELLSDFPRRIGVTERLRATVLLTTACDQLPAVWVASTPGNATDFVELKATAFTRDRDCPPQTREETRVVEVPGTQQGNFGVAVSFGEGGFNYGRGNCMGSGCQCTSSSPQGARTNGQACVSDCDCVPDLACLATATLGFRCGKPCQDELDCMAESRTCAANAGANPPMTCFATETECLNDNCPPGFECGSTGMGFRECLDRRGGFGQACACQGDCAPEDSCVADLASTPTCQRLCNRDVDCPLGRFVCGPTGFCRPLE